MNTGEINQFIDEASTLLEGVADYLKCEHTRKRRLAAWHEMFADVDHQEARAILRRMVAGEIAPPYYWDRFPGIIKRELENLHLQQREHAEPRDVSCCYCDGRGMVEIMSPAFIAEFPHRDDCIRKFGDRENPREAGWWGRAYKFWQGRLRARNREGMPVAPMTFGVWCSCEASAPQRKLLAEYLAWKENPQGRKWEKPLPSKRPVFEPAGHVRRSDYIGTEGGPDDPLIAIAGVRAELARGRRQGPEPLYGTPAGTAEFEQSIAAMHGELRRPPERRLPARQLTAEEARANAQHAQASLGALEELAKHDKITPEEARRRSDERNAAQVDMDTKKQQQLAQKYDLGF